MTTINARIASLLEAIDRPGSFCASGSAAFLAPALHVTGVGPIALPLLPAQAEQLLSVAEPAPYGKGGLTLLDPAVRRCWQLEPGQVDIAGRRWAETLQEIVARAAAGLGVSDSVSASFYKLLIYGPGSFFVPHRDTEKEPGMFATLVIVLPSAYAGGELIVRHKDREARLALRSEDPAEIAFAAFYADCLHEILPLDDGYRLTLVYNLIRQGRGTLPQPPDYRPQTDGIAVTLNEWRTEQKTWLPAAGPARDRADVAADEQSEEDFDEDDWDEEDPDEDGWDEDARDEDEWDEEEDEQADSIGRPGPSAEKLVFPLEYAYTQAERSFAALKGTDAAIATALTAAARQAGYSLYLALLTIEESGAAEYADYSGSRWDEAEFEAGEMIDRVMTLSDWCDVNDQPVALVPLPAEPGEFVPPDACDELTPDEEHFSEATGNAGASYERTYRRAALVLWPQERLFNVLGQGGVGVLLSWLEELASRVEPTALRQQAALRAQVTDLIRQILETWPARGYRADPPTETTRMLTVLARLQDAAAIETFVHRIMAEGAYQASDNPALIEALALLPPDRRTGLIARMTSVTAAAQFAACADLLARAAAAWPELPPANLKPAAEMLLDALPDGTRKPVPPAWEYRRDTLQPSFVVDLLAALCTIDPALAFRVILHILTLEAVYDMDAILVPAARTLLKQCKERPQAIEQLRLACLEHLRARIAEPLEPFPDWRRPPDVPCQCPRCSELSRFLADPQRRTWTFKANQADRDHVEETIAKARSDVDTITERRGRPYTLICTKNEASFERRTAQRAQDLNDVAALMERDD